MKLWYLWWSGVRRRGRVVAMLIRAASEDRAREIAVEQVRYLGGYNWHDPSLALITPITEKGDEEIIMEERLE